MLQRSPKKKNILWVRLTQFHYDLNCKYSHLFSVARMDVSHKTFMILNKNWSQILQTMCRGNVLRDWVIRRFRIFFLSRERKQNRMTLHINIHTTYNIFNDSTVEQNGLTSIYHLHRSNKCLNTPGCLMLCCLTSLFFSLAMFGESM